MEENLKTVTLYFKLDSSLEMFEDEDGNYREGYVQTKFKLAREDTNNNVDEYKGLIDRAREAIAKDLECTVDLITPVTLEEFLDNTDN